MEGFSPPEGQVSGQRARKVTARLGKVTVSAAPVQRSSEQVSKRNTGLHRPQAIDSEKLKDEK